ncbi:hypothetical protein ACFX15_021322 [Malus domestica]
MPMESEETALDACNDLPHLHFQLIGFLLLLSQKSGFLRSCAGTFIQSHSLSCPAHSRPGCCWNLVPIPIPTTADHWNLLQRTPQPHALLVVEENLSPISISKKKTQGQFRAKTTFVKRTVTVDPPQPVPTPPLTSQRTMAF